MTDETVKKIAKGAGIVFIGTGIGMFFAYLGMMIVARFLGPSDFGLISMASAVATIASTVVLVGMPDGVVRFVSFYRGKNDQERIKGVIISALEIVLPLGVVAGVLLFVFADVISVEIFDEPNLTPVLRIFSFSVPFFVLFYIFNRAIGGFQEMKYVVYVRDIFQNGIRLFLLIVLLSLGYGVYGAAFAYTSTVIAVPFVALYHLNKIFPIFSKTIKCIYVRKELFSFSWPLMFAGMVGLVMGWIDTLMIGYFSTSYAVGIYRASLATAGLLLIISSSFGSIFMPVITELYSQHRTKELKETNATVTKWIFLTVLPLVLLMIMFSERVLGILYGLDYIAGASALSILAFAYLIISVFRPTNQIISTVGRTRLIMVNTTVGAVFDVILNFYLIPVYGINGAAVATAISIIIVNALGFAEVYMVKHIHPLKLNYFKIFFSAIVSALVVYVATKTFFGTPTIYILIIMFILYMIVYFVLLLISKTFEQEDVVIMKAMEERSGIRSEWVRNVIGRFL